METKLRLYHDGGGYDLIREDDVPTGVQTLGDYDVETRDGTETRKKIDAEYIVSTDVTIPEDFDPTPVALMHLITALTDRHSNLERITEVAVIEGDAKLGARIAALLDAEVVDEKTEVEA